MKNYKYNNEGDGELSEDILKLFHLLMTRGEGEHANFDRVNMEGSNVGAEMNVCHSKAKELLPDICSINIYVSNNIQGVNNSILVGSEVKMGEPGLGISLGDVTWERDRCNKVNLNQFLSRFGFSAVLLCAFVLAVSLLISLFGLWR
ncbi:hypothetical protein BVRB_7g166560 [Beta vulgaris subsp. vulgaris]|nr:hypothetical protein BVRB_7g166560 [Beta vulgaris subsp. vulgaris]